MNWKRNLPSGTKDKLFREAAGSKTLENQVSKVFEQRKYQRVETPSIEFEDVFNGDATAETSHYRFFDQQGRLLVLRPDMTLPIGRVVATKGVMLPLKLYYSGKVFRSSPEMIGESNELLQAGIEIIGYSSIKAELESVITAYEVLKKLKVPNYHIEIGHAAIYQEILSILKLSEGEEEHFKNLLQNKSISGLAKFSAAHPSELDDFICKLPRLFGASDSIIPEAKKYTQNSSILTALDEMTEFAQLIQAYDPAMNLSTDLGVVPAMSYYSGLIFRGYADGIPDYFLSGGRYDHLLAQFGDNPIPAVGLAFDLDNLLDLEYQLDALAKLEQPKILIHYATADISFAEKLQRETAGSQLSLFDDFKSTLAFAEKWRISTIYLVSDGEYQEINVAEGKV